MGSGLYGGVRRLRSLSLGFPKRYGRYAVVIPGENCPIWVRSKWPVEINYWPGLDPDTKQIRSICIHKRR